MTIDESKKRTIGCILEEKARKNKDKIYLSYKGEKISYRELNQTANRLANGFLKMGIRKGDTVCLMLPNHPVFLYSWFALAKIGAIEVPVNTAGKGPILEHVINSCDAKVLVIDENLLDNIRFIEKELKNLKEVVVFCQGAKRPEAKLDKRFSIVHLDELFDGSDAPPQEEIRHSDLISILYTSGTTGPSKGAMLTHNSYYLTALENIKHMSYTGADIFYVWDPLFHAMAQWHSTIPALISDASIVLTERFSASRFWDEIRAGGATTFNYIGAIIAILWKQPPRPDDPDNPVRCAYGAPVPPAIFRDFENRFGLKLIEVYASTEAFCPLYNCFDAQRVGSCGKATSGFEVKIFDDDDNELPAGRPGEIVIRPNEPFKMMQGYYKMPERTVEAFRNLWFHTGDYGYMDEDGYFYFVDRKKDAIRRRGENISSYEVEKVVNSHPSVLESAAIAVPSELIEDEVKVLVVLKDGNEGLRPEELIAYCEDRMAYFMVPRFVEFASSLPKTPTQKVEKYKLKQNWATPSTWDREKAGYKLKK